LLPLLRSQTQAGLLKRLLLHGERSYTVDQLARALGVTPMSVRRELDKLLDAGIVERELIGRQGLYRPDRASPLFEPLRQLIERSVGVEALLRETLEEIEGVRAAAIFGSWARGVVAAQSGVDVLVVGVFDYAELIERLHELQERTGREINAVAMREGELEARRSEGFVQEILSSPKIPLIGQLETG
jgi:predicted ArsR family transcriptional regulator